MRRVLVALFVSVALLFASVAPAYADLYYVSATEGPLEAPATRERGVAADSWVLFDPHEVYSLHVNSVYMWLDDRDYVEAGWAWYAGDGPQAYVAYERRGYTTDQHRDWLGPVTPGQELHLEIALRGEDASGAARWGCRVGGYETTVTQDFTRATARVSSERQTYRDSCYGLFSALGVYDGTAWRPWRDMHIQNGDQDYGGYRLPGDGFIVH